MDKTPWNDDVLDRMITLTNNSMGLWGLAEHIQFHTHREEYGTVIRVRVVSVYDDERVVQMNIELSALAAKFLSFKRAEYCTCHNCDMGRVIALVQLTDHMLKSTVRRDDFNDVGILCLSAIAGATFDAMYGWFVTIAKHRKAFDDTVDNTKDAAQIIVGAREGGVSDGAH
jgi:hypothetical protein